MLYVLYVRVNEKIAEQGSAGNLRVFYIKLENEQFLTKRGRVLCWGNVSLLRDKSEVFYQNAGAHWQLFRESL